MNTMMTTSVQIAVGLEKVNGKVQLAKLAKELVVGLKITEIATMTNWPFPSYPPVPWTQKQIKEHAQQQRAQTEDAPL